MNKASLMGLLFLAGAANLQAEDFTFTSASIAAGGMADVELNLNCEADKWGGFQLDIKLPEGIRVYEDEDGLYAEAEDRLSFTYRSRMEYFGIDIAQIADGTYRILVDNNRGKTIGGRDGGLLLLRLVCDSTVPTGEYSIGVSNQKLANTDGSESTKPADNASAGSIIVRVDATVGASGYATFSWPLELDFTDAEVQAYIATEYANGWLHLEPVTAVPPYTGLILKGAPGTYHPVTAGTGLVPANVESNKLRETASGPVTAKSSDRIYALAQHEGKVGFYSVADDVAVPVNKAYLQLEQDDDSPSYIKFGGIETDIRLVGDGQNNDQWIRIDGTKSTHPRSNGVYVNQGHKLLIK